MILLKNPLAIIGLPLLVFGVHGVALLSGLYGKLHHFDSVMHFAGGLVAALSIYGMLGYARDRHWVKLGDRVIFRLLIISLVGLVTVGWEVLEFFIDSYWGTQLQVSIKDTVKDQVLGVLGACVAVLRLKL